MLNTGMKQVSDNYNANLVPSNRVHKLSLGDFCAREAYTAAFQTPPLILTCLFRQFVQLAPMLPQPLRTKVVVVVFVIAVVSILFKANIDEERGIQYFMSHVKVSCEKVSLIARMGYDSNAVNN
uniref:Uncharacterized protein n=1 Tax=Glossina pallidipes TaxID=7398 RepID=A0A1A9ZKU7_GLOPL